MCHCLCFLGLELGPVIKTFTVDLTELQRFNTRLNENFHGLEELRPRLVFLFVRIRMKNLVVMKFTEEIESYI